MNVEKFKRCDKIVWKAAYGIFKNLPNPIVSYAFGEVEDAYQQGWVCIYQSEKVKKLVRNLNEEEDGGLLYTTLYYDLYDYVRSVCGREDSGGSLKNKAIRNMAYFSGKSYPATSLFEERKESLNQEQKRMLSSFDSKRLFDGAKHNFNIVLSKSIVQFLNEKLTKKEMDIARELFFEESAAREVAERYGVSETRISQIKKKIIKSAFNFKK